MSDEILVHISTPATRQNDDLYRSLADAYIGFEACRRYHDIASQSEALQGVEDEIPHNVSVVKGSATPVKRSSNDVRDVGSSMFSTSKDSYGSFPSHLSSEDQERLDMQTYYDNEEDIDTAFIESSPVAAQALRSRLQDGYSTTDEDTEEDEVEVDERVEEESLQVHGIGSAQQCIRSSAVEPVPPVHSPETRSVSSSYQGFLDTTLDLSLPTKQDGDIDLHSLDFSKLLVDAFPPAPKVSIAQLSTLPSQITNHLAAIKTENPARFKPSKKLRCLTPDERGHWSVECSHWSQKLQYEFWTSLCGHVQSGRVGWGTTLHRDSGSSQTIGRVKIYCWGEVVEHVWLLLWLCSKGEISGLGAKWVDGDGIGVVEVL